MSPTNLLSPTNLMLITSSSTEHHARRHGGGKGYNLYLLSKQGLPVPPWVTLSARAFERFRAHHGLDAHFKEVLSALDKTASQAALKQASAAIEQRILDAPFPPEIEEAIKAAYAQLGSPTIAVRSSAADEDSAAHSFAGQLSSFLYVRDEAEALSSVKRCWASGYSERGLAYRLQNGFELTQPVHVAVVLQEMLDSEKSGVLFTADPIRGEASKMLVNAVYGVGEGLVSGLLDADTFELDKATGRVVRTEVVEKPTQLSQSKDAAGTEERPVPPHLVSAPSLDERELAELHRLGRAVEGFYRLPQDIEWGARDGRFFLLQARPITTPTRNDTGLLSIWDNSNIVESYGGITMPLTFSFAHHVYHSVYVQFCEILLVPRDEIRRMDSFLRNMLGLFYGRVFYNILNWYKLTSILPGFKHNRAFMETMMGTPHALSDEIADRIKPPGFAEQWSSKVRRWITGAKFAYFHFAIQGIVDRFIAYFHSVYQEYRRRDYSRMPTDEIVRHYHELEEKLLFEWKAPIINDYLCMVHFGLLKKLASTWLASLGPSIQNDLLCGEGKLESAEPTRELIRMAALVQQDAQLRSLIESTPADACLEALHRGPFPAFRARVERYIDLYGFRCMNEMKLEEKDLYQDPSFLFVCLKNYLRTGQTDLTAYERREREIREAAEAKVRATLSGTRRLVFGWSLKNARQAVRNRENTRFCRTRIYGVVRAMFHGVGRDFVGRGMLDRPEDVFFLEMRELLGTIDGTLTVQDLRALVRTRKEAYASYAATEPAPRMITRGPVYWQNEHTPKEEEAPVGDTPLPAHALQGTGCCPGTVEGVAKVVLSPSDDLNLNGEILVTLRTDPGWIPLYPSASALLVERGGLLSHSAIVAREMGLPTVVGIKGLTKRIQSGMRVRMNGETGVVEILEDAAASAPPVTS